MDETRKPHPRETWPTTRLQRYRGLWRRPGADKADSAGSKSDPVVVVRPVDRPRETQALPDPEPRGPSIRRRRPVIAHLMPWSMTTGGAQRFAADLAAHQVRFADVHILSLGSDHDTHWSGVLAGVTVHAPGDARGAEALLMRLAPDLVHHHHPGGGWLMAACRRLGCALIGTHHRYLDNGPGREACVVPICGDGDDVIRHGVDLERFTPGKRVRRTRKFVVGVVGRRSAEKLPESFVRALETFGDRDIVFRFIGRGADNAHAAAMEARLARLPHVELVNDIPPGDMPDAYRELDALVVPSVLESVSYAALEAMACGVPVVARDVEGLPETIGDAGLLAANDSGLLEAVARLALSRDVRRRLRQKARRRVEELFALPRMLADYDRLYAERSRGLVRLPDDTLDVSVVIPVKDTPGAWVAECAASVLGQEGARFEVIVVDDGSTQPDTRAAIDAFAKDNRVRVIRRETTGGVGAALNDGLRAARSTLIARIDADDRMTPGRLAEQVARFANDPELDVLSGQMTVTDADGHVRRTTALTLDPSRFIGAQDWGVAHPTVCLRRDVALRAGGYQPVPAQDFELWCRLWAAGARFSVADRVWAIYRTHPNQQTAGRASAEAAERVRARYRAERPDWFEQGGAQ